MRAAWGHSGTNPSCARCGYDLRGLPIDAWNCAECGSDLRYRRTVRFGQPVRRWKRVGFAACLSLIAVSFIWRGIAGARHQDWQPYKPFWWLRHDLESSDVRDRAAAETELQRRLSKLTDGQMIALVDTRYVVKAAPPGINNVSIAAAAKLRRAQKLDDARWIGLCRSLVSVNLTTRPTVRHGDPIAFRTSAMLTVKVPDLRMGVTVDVDEASVNQLPLIPDMHGLHTLQLSDVRDCCGVLTDDQWKTIVPGTHRIDSMAAVQLRFGTYGEAVFCEMTIPSSTMFSIVTPNVSPSPAQVQLSPPPSLYQALAPHSVGWGWIKVRLGDRQSRLPSDVSFNVFVRQGVMEHPVGSFYAPSGDSAPFTFTTPAIPLANEGFDIVLRPSQREAARSMKIGDFWAGELVFKDVTNQVSKRAQ
jgi:hypothetical protein